MPFPQCKVYSDGGHYIAIPHTTRPYRPRRKPCEEIITVTEEVTEEVQQPDAEQSAPSQEDAPMPLENAVEEAAEGTQIDDTLHEKPAATRLMTKKELFEELYARYQSLPRYKRKAAILKRMRPYFSDADAARLYVETNTWRKTRNLIARRVRMTRKINLQTFNFFVTFTYNSELHTEESFRKNSKTFFRTSARARAGSMWAYGNARPKRRGCTFTASFISPTARCRGCRWKLRIITLRHTGA